MHLLEIGNEKIREVNYVCTSEAEQLGPKPTITAIHCALEDGVVDARAQPGLQHRLELSQLQQDVGVTFIIVTHDQDGFYAWFGVRTLVTC